MIDAKNSPKNRESPTGSDPLERGRDTDHALREAYQAMRYEGAAPVWHAAQPAPTGLLVPVMAFALLCSLSVWLWSPFEGLGTKAGSRVAEAHSAEAHSAEAPVADVRRSPGGMSPGGTEKIDRGKISPSRQEVAEVVDLEEVVLGGPQTAGTRLVVPQGPVTSPSASTPSLSRSTPSLHKPGLHWEAGLRAVGPKAVPETADRSAALAPLAAEPSSSRTDAAGTFGGLRQLRNPARDLQRAGVSLPVAPPAVRFRLPNSPRGSLQIPRPRVIVVDPIVGGGAARD